MELVFNPTPDVIIDTVYNFVIKTTSSLGSEFNNKISLTVIAAICQVMNWVTCISGNANSCDIWEVDYEIMLQSNGMV